MTSAVPEVHAPDVHTRRRGVGARRTVPSAVRVPGVVGGTRTVAGGAELGRTCSTSCRKRTYASYDVDRIPAASSLALSSVSRAPVAWKWQTGRGRGGRSGVRKV